MRPFLLVSGKLSELEGRPAAGEFQIADEQDGCAVAAGIAVTGDAAAGD